MTSPPTDVGANLQLLCSRAERVTPDQVAKTAEHLVEARYATTVDQVAARLARAIHDHLRWPSADAAGLEARSRAIAKLDELRYSRAHIDGTGVSPLVTAFVAEQVGLPTRDDLHVDTIGHALQRAATENA